MKTFTPPPQNFTFRLGVFPLLLFVLFLIFSQSAVAHTLEWMMQITSGGSPVGANVYLYQGGQLIRQGTVSGGTPWTFNPSEGGWEANFGCDVHPSYEGGQTNSTYRTWDVIYPGSYIVRIATGAHDIYFSIYIPEVTSGADFNLGINLGNMTITEINDNRGVSEGSISNYVVYNITAKNSFDAAGDMDVDYSRVTIPNGGQTYNWASPWFPHHLCAVDQQPNGINFMQRFTDWSTTQTDRTITINTGNGIYTANFLDEYNITFQNSFSDATGGVINVNGQHNAPYQTTALQDIGIDASAVTQTINGIEYEFDHWSDASTEASKHFTPSGHTTYTAYFVGTPVNVNRNLSFEASDPNQPITVNWNDHPNSNVTYKIWRKSKYQQQPTSSPQLIGSVNSDTHSFIDYDFYGTNLGFTDWKLWYDVKGYFTLDGTSSADDYAQVFSNGMIAKKVDDLEDNITVSINENKIDNYPNPFNPSTIISYQLINAGHVTLKVYDNLGREIITLVNREQSSGKYSVNFTADNLASGIYYYRITADGFTATKKMILTK